MIYEGIFKKLRVIIKLEESYSGEVFHYFHGSLSTPFITSKNHNEEVNYEKRQ